MSLARLLWHERPPLVVCWGELLWDLFPDHARLGGAAANVAYHVAALGGEALLVSRVGSDQLGRRAIELLEHAGVDTRHVSVDPERPTGTVKVELGGGEPRFTIGDQVAWDRIAWSPELGRELERADAIVFGTLAQRGPLGRTALARALAAASGSAWRLCDLNLRPPFVTRSVVEQSLLQADAVKLNENESEALRTLFGVADVTRWLLEERGLGLVALTLGARGSVLSTREESCEQPAFALASSGDPVGAGDAFTAVLALLWPCRLPLEVVARAANRYAAFVASSPGAMPTVLPEVVAELAELIDQAGR